MIPSCCASGVKGRAEQAFLGQEKIGEFKKAALEGSIDEKNEIVSGIYNIECTSSCWVHAPKR
jgi:hypothetical protein